MRTVRMFLAIAAAASMFAQVAPAPPTYPSSGPTKKPDLPGDSLGYAIQLAITGRVLLDDRQAPPEPVEVNYLCRGTSSATATDSKGRFSIPIGRAQSTRTTLANDLPVLVGCRVQVRVPGFEDITVALKRPQGLSDLVLGDLMLKPASGQAGALFSTVSGKAPNKARGSYIRALENVGREKYDEALSALDKAVRDYPQYAAALQLKGQILEREGRRDEAKAAYRQAVEADPQYAKPLVQLAEMAAEDQDSAEAARWAAMVNSAVPGAFPGMYLIEGSAYFNLGRFDEAAKTAQAGLEADRTNFCPSLHKLLGEALYRKRDYSGAVAEFKRYIGDAPDASDISEAKARADSSEKLARLEKK